MKYIKTYANFPVNEEISLKGLSSIITSLFLTFNSAKALVPPSVSSTPNQFFGKGSSTRFEEYNSIEIKKSLDKTSKDLEELKKKIEDEQLVDLIESIQKLKKEKEFTSADLSVILNKIQSYIQSNNIDNRLFNDTISHLSKGDIKMIKSDYQELLKLQDSSESSSIMKVLLIGVLLLQICGLVYFIPYLFKPVDKF
jgi:predicted DNA-binding ArsR family transcriptional regulator